MKSIHQIEARRDAILEEIRSIRSMKRGSISKQYLKVRRKGRSEPALRGPYYVFSRREQDKTLSHRLTSQTERQQTQQDIDRYERFVTLCKQFEELTERLGQIERQQSDFEQEKKRRRSPSSKTGK